MIVDGYDPGGMTGVAEFHDATPVTLDTVSQEGFRAWLLARRAPDMIVCEDYRIRPKGMTGGWSHEWSKVETLRLIGAIELIAEMHGIPLVMQDPSIKGMANQLVFHKPYNKHSKDPMRHAKDALLHVRWYYHKNGLFRA